jgi:DNA-binding XRE family transcriptional regulator
MTLKEFLKKHKISQAKLAQMAEINQTQLNRSLNGHQKFYPSWKLRIAKALGEPLSELFADEGGREDHGSV